MENASKALLMAGGILIAIIIIGLLLIMVNQIGSYQKSQDSNKKDSQLAEFNLDFERYTDDKGIKGTDVISLINKVIDYNSKARTGGVNNSVDYNIKMSITISDLQKFNKKYAYDKENDSDSLFNVDSYTFGYGNTNNTLKALFDNFSANEGTLGIDNLKILSSIYNGSKSKNENVNNIKDKLKELYPNEHTYDTWNGNGDPTLDTIKKYRQYSEFKSSTFKIDQTKEGQGVVYENGQIQKFYFKFVK